MVVNSCIKHGVQVIEEVNHLNWSTHGRYCGETNNIREVDSYF